MYRNNETRGRIVQETKTKEETRAKKETKGVDRPRVCRDTFSFNSAHDVWKTIPNRIPSLFSHLTGFNWRARCFALSRRIHLACIEESEKSGRNGLGKIVPRVCFFFFFLLLLSLSLSLSLERLEEKIEKEEQGERNKVEVSEYRDSNRGWREVSLNFLRAGRAGAWR